MTAGAPAVEVRGLTKAYRDGTVVLNGVDLVVQPGEIVALVGTNGAGKSTLLRCLVRLTQPTSGTVLIGGADVGSASRSELRRIRRTVGIVFQRFHLVGRLTAFTNVVHGALGRRGAICAVPGMCPPAIRAEAMAALETVELAGLAGQRVEVLSGGQQQRVAVARMLMQQPRVVLADEPVASLDPKSARTVLEMLRAVARERGCAVVMALHQMDLALEFADRVVGLKGGVVQLDCDTASCSTALLESVYAEAS